MQSLHLGKTDGSRAKLNLPSKWGGKQRLPWKSGSGAGFIQSSHTAGHSHQRSYLLCSKCSQLLSGKMKHLLRHPHAGRACRWHLTKAGGDEEETGRAAHLAPSSLAHWPWRATNHRSARWNFSSEYGRKGKAALSNMKVLLTAADQPATGLTAVCYFPTWTQFIIP